MTDAETKGLNLNRRVTQNIRTIGRYNLRRSSPSRLVAHDHRHIATMMISRFRRRSESGSLWHKCKFTCPRSSVLDPDTLGIHKSMRTKVRELSAIPAVLDTADGHARVRRRHTVDEDITFVQIAPHLASQSDVSGPYVAAQPKLTCVRHFHGHVCIRDADDRHNRAQSDAKQTHSGNRRRNSGSYLYWANKRGSYFCA